MPPPSFNPVSQDDNEEREVLDIEDSQHHDIDDPSSSTSAKGSLSSFTATKYVYLSPKTKKIICGSASALLLLIVIIAISSNQSPSSPYGRGNQWPPPEVTEDDYSTQKLSTNVEAQPLYITFQNGDAYTQITKMKTSTKLNLGFESFAESVYMTSESDMDVKLWYAPDAEPRGFQLNVVFTHISVSTEDSGGDVTYYNSYAQNGETDFDAVLETMIDEMVTVDIDMDYLIADEEDSENALEEMEQEYSLGTTTGLSAMDQVSQVTNLLSYLPPPKKAVKAGDKWDVLFETDLVFSGSAELLGYVNYNGFQCAVVRGFAKVDNEKGDSMIGDDAYGTMLEVEDGTIETIIFWDPKFNIPRYAKTDINMKTDIEDVDGVDGIQTDDLEEMTVPMTETIEMYFAPN